MTPLASLAQLHPGALRPGRRCALAVPPARPPELSSPAPFGWGARWRSRLPLRRCRRDRPHLPPAPAPRRPHAECAPQLRTAMCHMPFCSRPLPARPPWRPRAPGTKFARHRAWPALKVGMRQSRGRPDACEDMSGRGIALVARSSPHRCQAATLPSFTRQSGPEHSLPSNRRACARHSSRLAPLAGPSTRQSTRNAARAIRCCSAWPSCSRPYVQLAGPASWAHQHPRGLQHFTSIPSPQGRTPRAGRTGPPTASTPSPTRALPPATCASTCSRA
jgi:hypothetical protein